MGTSKPHLPTIRHRVVQPIASATAMRTQLEPRMKAIKGISNGLKDKPDKLWHTQVIEVETSSGKLRPRPTVTQAGGPKHVAADVQATALPDPIPVDSPDLKPSPAKGTTLTVQPLAIATSITIPSTTPSVSTFIPVVSSLVATTTVWATPSSIAAVSSTQEALASNANSITHLPTFAIVLLAFGSTSLAICACILTWHACRGKRRFSLPTVSAPILHDSPLFGGKERLSRGMLADPSFGNLRFSMNKSASIFRNSKGDGWRPLYVQNAVSDSSSEKTLRPPDSFARFEKAPIPSPSSVYPATPTTAVGVALETPAHAPVINQPLRPLRKDVPTISTRNKRMSTITTITTHNGPEISSPTFTETMISYQSPRPAPTPGKPKSALKPSTPSREVRSHGSLRKNTNTFASQGGPTTNPRRQSVIRTGKETEEPFAYTIPSVKSQERRDRDTKALTNALGLTSPPMDNNMTSAFSPVSIYPEDSLSVKQRTSAYKSEMPSPTSMSAALGSFMLQDYPSTATFNSYRNTLNDPFNGEPLSLKKKGARDDKPPRVPSPPPLPSLSQMALANAEPEYRSPTYSIYGYYESQRKSKASFAGDML